MAMLLSGKEVTAALNDALKARTDALYQNYIFPVLATVRVGQRDDDIAYERGILKRCESAGVRVRRYILPVDRTAQRDLELLIDELNANALISGILLFRPLPADFDEEALCRRIAPAKDVDCASDADLCAAFLGTDGFSPCTAEAVMRVLEHYGIDCAGKRAVVIGRSKVIGKPAAMLLLNRNATVTVCHSKTENLQAVCRDADILIAAAGKPKMVTADFVKPGAAVLDVGIHWDETAGTLCGDVDFESVSPVAGCITPVPGGIGPVTTSVLVAHVIDAAERNAK